MKVKKLKELLEDLDDDLDVRVDGQRITDQYVSLPVTGIRTTDKDLRLVVVGRGKRDTKVENS